MTAKCIEEPIALISRDPDVLTFMNSVFDTTKGSERHRQLEGLRERELKIKRMQFEESLIAEDFKKRFASMNTRA